jgi:hypothetical protein
VVQRFGNVDALLSKGDKPGKSKRYNYAPINLKPAFAAIGKVKPDVKVSA